MTEDMLRSRPDLDPISEVTAEYDDDAGDEHTSEARLLLPRLRIDAFVSEDVLTIEHLRADRRARRAQIELFDSGLETAIARYEQAPAPDIILVEQKCASKDVVALVDRLAEHCPSTTRLVLLGDCNDVALYRDLVKAGVSDYLLRPVKIAALLDTLLDVVDDDDAGGRVGKVIAFLGVRGGVGSSMLSHNVADAINHTYDAATILVDADIGFGTAAIQFNIEPPFSLGDAIKEQENLTPEVLDIHGVSGHPNFCRVDVWCWCDSGKCMIRPSFLSVAERLELEACTRSHREDHGIARRANAILLLDDGESCAQIARFLYLDDDTIRGWHKSYRESGWEALAVDGWQGGQSRMTSDQEAALCTWLEGRFCRSTVEIRSHIASEFGLGYSHSGSIKLLARLGFEYRKPKALPRAVPAEKQEAFIALYTGLLNGLSEDEAVYFADAVHPEYQTKPAFGWVKQGSHPAVKTTAGRGRVNIHGALNLETFDAPFIEPTTVDGVSATQLLAKIEARNPDKRIIHVIWDNAAYHKGPDVRAFCARPECRIHLIQLPPYCPHLNPIERLWAVMHQYVTHNQHYPTQKQFANAILNFFRRTIPNEWKSFRSQVSDNFRVITQQNFRVLG